MNCHKAFDYAITICKSLIVGLSDIRYAAYATITLFVASCGDTLDLNDSCGNEEHSLGIILHCGLHISLTV